MKKIGRQCPRSEAGGLEAGESCIPYMQDMPKGSQQVTMLHQKYIGVDPYATLSSFGKKQFGHGRDWLTPYG